MSRPHDYHDAVNAVLRDTTRFLDALPDDLGRGSLNGWKAQLRHKIGEMLTTNAELTSAQLDAERNRDASGRRFE